MNSEEEKSGLIARRDELRARLKAIEDDYRRGLDADSEERAVQLENAEVLNGITQSIAEELRQVEEKLGAISN